MSTKDRKVNIARRQEMPFGKYQGETLGDICDDDIMYIDWLIGQEWLKDPLKSFVHILHTQYSSEIEANLEQKEHTHGFSKYDFEDD